MRITVSSTLANQSTPTQLINTGKGPSGRYGKVGITLQNNSAVPIQLDNIPANLVTALRRDGSGTIDDGVVLAPNGPPLVIERFEGILYAWANAAGGFIDIFINYSEAPC